MPSMEWLKNEFSYGYDSGNILSLIPNKVRCREERIIGGSYRSVFKKAVRPFLNPSAKVLELGPGRGAWSKAILSSIPKGQLHTVDFQDVTPWLLPELYSGRLFCHQIDNISFDCVQDNYFDFFWSFGVLCHNNIETISKILALTLNKVAPGGYSVHQYSDWEKLDAFGWEKGAIPETFKNQPDDEIWWPRNTQKSMRQAATDAGWTVLQEDLNLVKRDSLILLRKEGKPC